MGVGRRSRRSPRGGAGDERKSLVLKELHAEERRRMLTVALHPLLENSLRFGSVARLEKRWVDEAASADLGDELTVEEPDWGHIAGVFGEAAAGRRRREWEAARRVPPSPRVVAAVEGLVSGRSSGCPSGTDLRDLALAHLESLGPRPYASLTEGQLLAVARALAQRLRWHHDNVRIQADLARGIEADVQEYRGRAWAGPLTPEEVAMGVAPRMGRPDARELAVRRRAAPESLRDLEGRPFRPPEEAVVRGQRLVPLPPRTKGQRGGPMWETSADWVRILRERIREVAEEIYLRRGVEPSWRRPAAGGGTTNERSFIPGKAKKKRGPSKGRAASGPREGADGRGPVSGGPGGPEGEGQGLPAVRPGGPGAAPAGPLEVAGGQPGPPGGGVGGGVEVAGGGGLLGLGEGEGEQPEAGAGVRGGPANPATRAKAPVTQPAVAKTTKETPKVSGNARRLTPEAEERLGRIVDGVIAESLDPERWRRER